MADIEIRESVLEDIIFNHLSSKKFNQNIQDHFEFENVHIIKRQLNLGAYGIPDIVTFQYPDTSGIMSVNIFELKKRIVDKNTITQALKYKTAIEKYFKDSDMYELDITIYLIGNSISKEKIFSTLASSIESIGIYTYGICPENGLILDRQELNTFDDLETPKELKEIFTCCSYEQHDLSCEEYYYFNKEQCDILEEYHGMKCPWSSK